MKQCAECKQLKELSAFTKHPTSRDGFFAKCNDCRAQRYLRRNIRPSKTHFGYIYLIRATNGLVKIGIAKDVDARFRQIAASSPLEVSLIAADSVDDVETIEYELHNRFIALHSHAEWFALSDTDITSAIEAIGEFKCRSK